MYWLQRPNHLKRLAAVAIIVVALLWDLSEAATEPYPVAAASLAAGVVVSPDDVAWVELPVDSLPIPALEGVTTAVAVGVGEPLTPAVLRHAQPIPDGWWVVPLVVGTLAAPGDEALLVVADPPISVVGVVLEPQIGDPYDLDHRPAAVAVPPDSAPLIAAAEQQGLLVTAIRPSDPGG